MIHPFEKFHYCPKCGSAQFVVHDFKSKHCESCEFVYYFNTAAAVAAFILDEQGRLLVAKRAHEPAKGTFDLPGGFVDLHETAEEALLREIREETGLTIANFRYLFSLPNIYRYSDFEVHTLDLFYVCQAGQISSLSAADDVSALFFLTKEEIRPEMFGLESIRKAVTKYFQ